MAKRIASDRKLLFQEVVKIYPKLDGDDFEVQEHLRERIQENINVMPLISEAIKNPNISHEFRDVLRDYESNKVDIATVLLDPYSRKEYSERPEYPYAPWKQYKMPNDILDKLHSRNMRFKLELNQKWLRLVQCSDDSDESKLSGIDICNLVGPVFSDIIPCSDLTEHSDKYKLLPTDSNLHITIARREKISKEQMVLVNDIGNEVVLIINGKQGRFVNLCVGYSLDYPSFQWLCAISIDAPDLSEVFGHHQWHLTIAKCPR